ncbi:MAG: DUF6785 family protein [Phycisphaeraceae bacterium]
MTLRALIIGTALGLFIVSFTFFNDQVIRQSFFIANHLPASVFGFGVLLLLGLNPLARLMSRRMALGPSEVAIILALGLAACSWPGSNLMRYFGALVTRPVVVEPTKTNWQAQRVMSYLPGGSPLLAEGYVRQWQSLLTGLAEADADDPADPAGRFRAHLSAGDRRVIEVWAEADEKPDAEDRGQLVRAINRVLIEPDLYDEVAFADVTLPDPAVALIEARHDGTLTPRQVQRLNRYLLEATFPSALRSPPTGSGLLVNDGAPHPAIDLMLTGPEQGQTIGFADVPWGVWWPTLRLWGGALALVAVATLCMIVVVHPQWSRRELLTYPVVQLAQELSREKEGRLFPAIAYNRLFWIGFALVFGLHTLNGLANWFPGLPSINRQFDMSALTELFPNASRVYGNHNFFRPMIYFAVIGFGFLIPTQIATSLGLSVVAWMMLGSLLLAFGTSLETGHFVPGANGSAIRFGAYFGMALMIFYFGRHYYLRVAAGAVGLPRREGVNASAIWAARLMVFCLAGATFLLVRYGGLSMVMTVLLLAVVMMIFLVLARINVETGLFYAQPDWLPVMILAGFFGYQGVGTEAMAVLMLASVVFVMEPRETAAPFLANGLRLVDRLGGLRVGRAATAIGVMLVVALVVAIVVSLTIQYNIDQRGSDGWVNEAIPEITIDRAAVAITELSARNELAESTGVSGLEHFQRMQPMAGHIPWTLLGIGLVIGCAAAQLRLPWWPIHPVLFLVWGTYPANNFAVSFLLAAAIKGGVLKLAGLDAYRRFKPFMVGLIVAELMSVLLWSMVGASYYLSTGLRPSTYRIFPG